MCYIYIYIYIYILCISSFMPVGENVLGGRKGKRLMYLEWTLVHSHQYFACFTPSQIPTKNKYISCASIILVLLFSFFNIAYIFNF